MFESCSQEYYAIKYSQIAQIFLDIRPSYHSQFAALHQQVELNECNEAFTSRTPTSRHFLLASGPQRLKTTTAKDARAATAPARAAAASDSPGSSESTAIALRTYAAQPCAVILLTSMPSRSSLPFPSLSSLPFLFRGRQEGRGERQAGSDSRATRKN